MADQSKKYKFDISNLNLHYGDFHALKDVNMQIEANKITAFIGPSGCGKTTVTRLANGLIPHFFHGNLSGQVNVNGMDTRETEIAALSDAVGTVFQNPRTQFFNTDTDSEIVFGLENRGIPREALRSRLDELTEELHLTISA